MADLTLPEIRTAKTTMEQSIQKAVNEAVQVFRDKTGYVPHSINVVMREITMVGKPPFNVVDRVRTEIDFQL